MVDTINICSQLENAMNFRISEINKIKDYFIAKICEKETMN